MHSENHLYRDHIYIVKVLNKCLSPFSTFEKIQKKHSHMLKKISIEDK